MAHLIPSLGAARFDTRGEQRLAERLRDTLEDNAWIWHNLPAGPRGRRPDFVLLHPSHGLLVLEVKDWRLERVLRADRKQVELLTDFGPKPVDNPLEQARRYLMDVVNDLCEDPKLRYPVRHPRAGHPVVPYGFGAVFANITRRQFAATDLAAVLPPAHCLFRDEFAEGTDADALRARVWSMIGRRFGAPLSLPQIDRLRARLFPEIVVGQIAPPFASPVGAEDDRRLAVLDLQQEQLARSLGGGHRVVRGVAGSGKTLLLAFRAANLAQAATRPVLVLCYGNGIAGRLENAMQDRAVEDRVQVYTFHSWCYRMLRAFDLPPPASAEFSDYGECLREGVRRVVDAVERGLIPAGQYDAVLIDEAHDFEEDWLRLAVRMVNPATRALMVVYDDAQAIYKGRVRPVWSQLGIEAKGRTTVLRMNYRNTAQILALAKRFAADVLGLPGLAADDEPDVLLPEHGGRQGPAPQLLGRVGLRDEAQAIAEWLHVRHAAGRAWSELAVLYPRHAIGRLLARVLAAAGVPIDVASDHRRRIDLRLDAVRLLTMHNAKGLEFPGVAIAGLGELGTAAAASEDDVRLTYVALTRATHELLLTYSRPTALVRRLLDCERG